MPKGFPKNGINKGWFKKGNILSEEHKRKISNSLMGHRNFHHFDTPQKISKSRQTPELIAKSIANLPKDIKGKNHPRWKGGITPLNSKSRSRLDYRLWRKAVLERDNWTCWICERRGGILRVHHLKGFAEFPKLRFILSNGITLCEFCHKTYTDYWESTVNKLSKNLN